MANLEQIVSRKAENDTKWKEAQQAERENTTAMQDAGITEITSNPEAYARYLEMQGDNPSYSAGNIALVMFGNPEATMFGTRDRWKTLNRSVMDSEKNNGVKIFARSPMGRGYTLADAYDIKQTQGRDISRITLQNDSIVVHHRVALLSFDLPGFSSGYAAPDTNALSRRGQRVRQWRRNAAGAYLSSVSHR